MAMAVGGLGLVAWGRGGARLSEAKQFFEESLALCREIGHQSHVQIRLALLGHVSNSMGSYEEASSYFQEAWDLAQQLGKKAEVSWLASGLGEATLGLGNLGAARRYLLEALETPRVPIALEALVNWATLLKKEADLRNGSVVLPATGVAAGDATNGTRPAVTGVANQGVPTDHEQKQQAVEILSLVLNQPATIQRYKDKAMRLLAELAAELPMEVMVAAQEQGRTKMVQEVVAEIVGQTR
jgi:tetratricopeptide (TPR) repeat protein